MAATITPITNWRPAVTFADRLRLVRLQYGEMLGRKLDQREMARCVDVGEANWRSWEAGASQPKELVITAKRIADATGVSPAWLLGLDESDPNNPSSPGSLSPWANRRSPSTIWYRRSFGQKVA